MMKILFYSPLSLEYGRGGELSIIELVSGLNPYFDIILIDTNRTLGENLLTKDFISEKLKGMTRIYRIRYLTLNILNKNFSLPRPTEIFKLFKEINKVDFFYTSSNDIKTLLLLFLYHLIQRKTKFIIGFRKPLFSEKLFSIYNLKLRIVIILCKIFKKNVFLHTISQYAKFYLRNFINPKRVYHIIHALDLSNYMNIKPDVKEKSFLTFLYVGYLDAVHKGVDVLIESIRSVLKNYSELELRFEICGTGPLESKVKQLESDFPHKVKAHGYVNYDEIPNYYAKSDVFLFTSRREPFGRVLIEALAAKLVVICSKTFGSVEILGNKEFAFFLEDLNPLILSQKIENVYQLWRNEPEEFSKLQERAQKFAIENYSFSKELTMFRTLFKKLI
jgi:glycosyltransferase involved in cell wall biosynthesis